MSLAQAHYNLDLLEENFYLIVSLLLLGHGHKTTALLTACPSVKGRYEFIHRQPSVLATTKREYMGMVWRYRQPIQNDLQ